MPPRYVPFFSLNLITFINLILFLQSRQERSDSLRALPNLLSSKTISFLVWIYMENRIIKKGPFYLSFCNVGYLTAAEIT